MDEESIWRATRAMQSAVETATRAADRMEEASQRIERLLGDGYGGNGVRLMEALELANTPQPEVAEPSMEQLIQMARELRLVPPEGSPADVQILMILRNQFKAAMKVSRNG